MARAIWSGSISFGLVNVPVKMHTAVRSQDLHFHQFDPNGNRIRQKRVSEKTGKEVDYSDIVKGYEVKKGQFVMIDPDELDAYRPESTKTIDIEDFVDLDEIDPIFYDHPYYLAPGTGAAKPYKLLLDAMKEAGKVGIGRLVLRSKEHLVAIRPRDGVLTLETMLFADEVIDPDDLDDAPEDGKAKVGKKELEMARQLIDSLSGDFEPEKYHDEYRERVLDMIERKAEGEEVVIEAPPEEPKKAPDLMAALEASIADAKKQSGGGAKRKKSSTEASGNGDGSKPKSKSGGKSKSRSGSSKKKTAKKS